MQQLLKDLLSIDTVNSQNSDKVREVVESYLEMEAEIVESSHVKNFLFKKGSGKNLFVMCGHYDVVPAGDWEEAFTPIEKDGFIYARGASDMKGGLAALIHAFKQVPDDLPFTLCLAVVGDEEKGGRHGAYAVLKHLQKDYKIIRYLGAEPVHTEKPLGMIKVGRRGTLWLYVKIKGISSHGSRPYEGKSPIYFLPQFINYIRNLTFNDKPDMMPTTLGITNISCVSGATNVHAATCEISLDIRYNYGNKEEEIIEKIERGLAGWDYEIKKDDNITEPYPYINKDKEYEKLVKDIIKEKVHVEPESTTIGGSSDARFFGYRGIGAIEVGPRSHRVHAKGEGVSIKDVELVSEVHKEIILRSASTLIS